MGWERRRREREENSLSQLLGKRGNVNQSSVRYMYYMYNNVHACTHVQCMYMYM